jgi:hypothetical protein
LVIEHDQSASPAQGDLNREITELQALRAHLAELEKAVSSREEWLAAVTGTTPPPAITDCETLSCVFNTIWHKTKYGLSALFTSNTDHDNDGDDSDEGNSTNIPIPLPPWRNPQNATDDVDGGSKSDPSNPPDSTTPKPTGGFNPWYPFAIFLVSFLVFSILRGIVRRAISGRRRRDDEWDGLVLHVRETRGSEGISPEEPPRRWWRWVGQRVWKGLRLSWRKKEGGVRLGEEVEIEAGCEYRDEKVGFADEGEDETDWDEKEVEGLDEERGRSVDWDGRGCWTSGEDGFQVFERRDENGAESDRRSSRESLDSPSSPYSSPETSSLGDELASFRMAVDLVESMFAAEQGRTRER